MALGRSRKKKPRTGNGAVERDEEVVRDLCFVICPFGGWHDRYYEEIYAPAAQDAGLEVKRVDDLYRPSAIVHDIWQLIQKACVMIADLTGKNANVFYELGLAHASGKAVILLAQSMDDVPFDLRALRVIQYDVQNPDWGRSLKGQIVDALSEILSEPQKAILQPFVDVRRDAGSPMKPVEAKLVGIEQQVQALRADLAPMLRPPGKDVLRTPEPLADGPSGGNGEAPSSA